MLRRAVGLWSIHRAERWSTRFHEFKDLCHNMGLTLSLTEKDWVDRVGKSGHLTKVPIHCGKCDFVCTKTSIISFLKFQLNCRCRSYLTKEVSSRGKYMSFLEICKMRDCTLMLTEEEWEDAVTSRQAKVPVQCNKCEYVCLTTSYREYRYLGRLGCLCTAGRRHVAVWHYLKRDLWTSQKGDVLWKVPVPRQPFPWPRYSFVLVDKKKKWRAALQFYPNDLNHRKYLGLKQKEANRLGCPLIIIHHRKDLESFLRGTLKTYRVIGEN